MILEVIKRCILRLNIGTYFDSPVICSGLSFFLSERVKIDRLCMLQMCNYVHLVACYLMNASEMGKMAKSVCRYACFVSFHYRSLCVAGPATITNSPSISQRSGTISQQWHSSRTSPPSFATEIAIFTFQFRSLHTRYKLNTHSIQKQINDRITMFHNPCSYTIHQMFSPQQIPISFDWFPHQHKSIEP